MFAIHNAYPQPLFAAYMFYSPDACGGEGGDWQAIGWFTIQPGATATLYANDLDDVNNRFWYYYAEATDGVVWSGDVTTYVTDEAFNICQGIGSTAYRSVRFRELDVGDNDDYTLTLTP
jgi:uncharacterized membrane protein